MASNHMTLVRNDKETNTHTRTIEVYCGVSDRSIGGEVVPTSWSRLLSSNAISSFAWSVRRFFSSVSASSLLMASASCSWSSSSPAVEGRAASSSGFKSESESTCKVWYVISTGSDVAFVVVIMQVLRASRHVSSATVATQYLTNSNVVHNNSDKGFAWSLSDSTCYG